MIPEEQSSSSNFFVDLLRWVFALPAALAAAYLAYVLTGWAVRFGLSYADIRADSVWVQLMDVTLVHGVMGAAFVYAGAFMVPRLEGAVSIILCVIAIAGASFLAFSAARPIDWWALTGAVSVLIGAVTMVIAIHRGDVEVTI